MTRFLLAVLLVIQSISSTAIEPPPTADRAYGMQFQCLALTAFTEARNQGEMGMALVVHTILQRAQRKKTSDVCAIAARSYDGFRDWRTARLPWRINPKLWELAVQATGNTLAGHYDFAGCRGATHYFNPKVVRPAWARKLEHLCTYRDHTFFVERSMQAT